MSEKMNPEVKKVWLEKLRSGKYAQTKTHLRDQDGYCCLGVLCDAYAEETGELWDFDDMMPFAIFLDKRSALPDEVVEWAGLSDCDPTVEDIRGRGHLSAFNDGGHTFARIADLIEKHL